MIVGCDYSTKAVELAYHGADGCTPVRWAHQTFAINEFSAQQMKEIAAQLRVWGCWSIDEKVIYIEQPWVGHTGGKNTGYINPMTSMAMVKVSTAVQVVALQQGYRVEWAHPSSWRSKILPKQRYTKAQAKAASKAWAATHTGLAIVQQDDNAADACCIAAFGELREQDGA